MTAEEGQRVLDAIKGKWDRNPTVSADDASRKLKTLARRKKFQTRGMYPEFGQRFMDGYVKVRRRDG